MRKCVNTCKKIQPSTSDITVLDRKNDKAPPIDQKYSFFPADFAAIKNVTKKYIEIIAWNILASPCRLEKYPNCTFLSSLGVIGTDRDYLFTATRSQVRHAS